MLRQGLGSKAHWSLKPYRLRKPGFERTQPSESNPKPPPYPLFAVLASQMASVGPCKSTLRMPVTYLETNKMTFTNFVRVMSVLAIVAVLATANSADAGLFGCLKKKCCEPVCCEPEPVCCEPAPEPCCEPVVVEAPCCEPAPAPCCEPEPVCCEPAPVCCEPCPPKKGFFARLMEKCAARRAAKCCPCPPPCGC